MCMSTRRSRSGGRITVTSAAVARGSPVRAASQCSWVDGCHPMNQLARGAPPATRTLADALAGHVSRVGTAGLAALARCAAFRASTATTASRSRVRSRDSGDSRASGVSVTNA